MANKDLKSVKFPGLDDTYVIPDYTDDIQAVQDAVDDLAYLTNVFDDIPGTVQTVSFGTDGKPSTIVHTEDGTTVRTDTFTWATDTVTETRTLADGHYVTITTNLSTLVTTISEIQEGT